MLDSKDEIEDAQILDGSPPMPKYRWATDNRHGYWCATRREALDWAERQGLAVRDRETGKVVLRGDVWLEQR